MEKYTTTRSAQLAVKLSALFRLESDIDAILSVSMYIINKYMDAERSSVFLLDPLKQQLTSYSSLDLAKQEICMSKSTGVAGWVLENRMAAVINDAYSDSRFFRGVDDMTGFHTRNLICCPLIDGGENCFGTLQALNLKNGKFQTDDLELLSDAARLLAGAINKSDRYDEMITTHTAHNELRKGMTTALAMAQ
jgi:GAF domain-containing protein